MAYKDLYRQRLADGVCPQCGGARDVPRRKSCAKCLAAERSRRVYEGSRLQKMRASRKRMGLCVRCGKEAIPGTTNCGYCAEAYADRNVIRRAQWAKEGLCWSCGAPRVEGRKACQKCLDRQCRYRRKKRVADKLKNQGLVDIQARCAS